MNILPSLGTRWSLTNCTMNNLTFIFTSAGTASVTMQATDIKTLPEQAYLNVIVEPDQTGYDQELSCIITIVVGTTRHLYTCILSNNGSGLSSNILQLPSGVYDTFTITFIAKSACTLYQVALDMQTQSIEEALEELRSELPKLLDDYNTYDITLTNEEVTVGLITANLLENTDLQGHFSFSFIASTAAEIVFRIYDDSRKCLYSPSIVSVVAGKHTIGFPHAYLKSKVGYHNFYVTLQATSGTVKIPTRSFLYTIDGAHMAERLLDSFYKIDDITAKTTIDSVEPTLLYTVGVVDNIATIRHIEPNSLGVSNWTADFAITNVKKAAIEFNGSWYTSTARRMLVTDSTPTLFYTDMSDILWVQVFNSADRLQLATSVIKVCALRGWRYVDNLVSNDTGLIVAYIKTNGIAYYRQYISNTETPYWSSEEALPFTNTTNPLVSISASRLNDYRIAFTVEDSLGNGYSLITRRYYQADTVENTTIETVDANSSIKIASYINPQPILAWNVSNTETFVQFDYPIDDFVGKQAAFKLRDANNIEDAAVSTERYDDYTIKIIHSTISGFAPPLSVIFTNSYTDHINGPLVCTYEGLPFAVQSFVLPFEAIDFSPKGYSFETVSIAGANVTISFIPIGIKNGYNAETVGIAGAGTTVIATLVSYKAGYNGTENVQVLNANATIVPTKVGTDPL